MNINISDLADGLIVITKWHAELALVSTDEEFNSYGGIEMRMVITDFKVKIKDEVNMNKYPASLYRDDEVKITLSKFINEQRTKNLLKVLKSSAGDP